MARSIAADARAIPARGAQRAGIAEQVGGAGAQIAAGAGAQPPPAVGRPLAAGGGIESGFGCGIARIGRIVFLIVFPHVEPRQSLCYCAIS